MSDATCSEAGCENRARARGLCASHYARHPDGVQQFWSYVAKGSAGQCWEWQRFRDSDGYGRFRSAGAHRLAYEFTFGPIPSGLQIDHLCRNPACVNPAHLEVVTGLENTRRAVPYRSIRAGSDDPLSFRCVKGHSVERIGLRPDGYPKCLDCMADYQRAYRTRTAARCA